MNLENDGVEMLKPSRLKSIRGRLILLLLIVLSSVILVEAFIYYQRFKAQRSAEFQANLEMAHAVGKNFETFLQGLVRSEVGIGLALTASRTLTDQDRNRMLDKFAGANPAVRSVMWMNPDGLVVAASFRPHIGYDLSDRSFFYRVKEGRDWAVSELIIGKATKKPAVTIGCGIRDKYGRLLGVVGFATELDRLDAVLGIPRSKGAGFSLIDNKGMHVFRYPSTKYTWERRNWLKYYPVIENALKGKDVLTRETSLSTGKKVLAAFTPISSIGWVASASRAENEVMKPIISTLLIQAGLVLLVTLMGFGTAIAFSRPISESIIRLRDHAKAVGRGELEKPAPVSGTDELKELAVVFNKMAMDVQSREAALRESERRWVTTLASIGDAVIATDPAGRVTFINSVARGLTGWGREDAAGQPIQNIFRIIDEKTLEPREDLVKKVLKEGSVIVLSNNTALITREGKSIPIEDSAAPIKDKEGQVTGAILVFHDVSEKRRAQEELKASHDRAVWLAKFPDENPNPIVRVSTDGSVLYCNPPAAKMPGWECTVGGSIDWLHPLISQGKSNDAFEQEIEVGGRDYAVFVAPFPAEGYVNLYGRDITERKRAEEKLRENEKKYRILTENTPGVIQRFDKNLRIIYISNQVEEATGMPSEQFIGKTNEELGMSLELCKIWNDLFHKVDTSKGAQDVIFDFPGPHGVKTYFLRVVPEFAPDGSVESFLGISTDITGQKQAETALRESEERYRGVVENTSAVILRFDQAGIITFANQRALDFFGYSTEELIGKPAVGTIVPPRESSGRDLAKMVDLIAADLDAFHTNANENICKDGRRIWLEWTNSGVYGPEGRLKEFLSVGIDITERKRVEDGLQQRTEELQHLTETLEERVAERTRELADLTAQLVSAQENERRRVSYDLHDNVWQILLAIRAEIEHLFSGQEDLPVLRNRSRRVMSDIVNLVGRIRSMQGDLWPYVLDDIGVGATIDWYCREFGKDRSGLAIEIKNDMMDDEIPSSARIIIYRILQEALDNIAKYSRANQVTVRLMKGDRGMALSVEDNGVGFDPEEKIAKKSPWGGLGLLSIKARTELSGGSFEVESAKNKGTVIRATWTI